MHENQGPVCMYVYVWTPGNQSFYVHTLEGFISRIAVSIHISGFFIDKQSTVERMTAQASNEPNPIIVSGSDPQVSVLAPKIDRITELQDGVGKRLKTFEVFGLLIVMLTPQSICKTSSRRQVG